MRPLLDRAPWLALAGLALALFWPLALGGSHLVPFHVNVGDPFQAGLDLSSDRPDWRTYDQTPVTLSYVEKHLFASGLKRGEFALWNPYNGLGYPLVGDDLCQPLAPLFFPFLAWPTPWVFSLCLVLNLLFGGLGMDRFLKGLGAGAWGRSLGAALFAFNPYTLKFAAYSDVWAYAWFPWLFLAADAMAHRVPGALAFGAVAALMGMSGHLEETFMGASAALFYALARLVQARGWSSVWRRPGWVAGPLLALGFSAWWLAPFFEWVANSWSPRMGVHQPVTYAFSAVFLGESEILWLPPLLLLALVGCRRRDFLAGLLPCLVWPLALLFQWPAGFQKLFDLGFMSGRYTRALAWFALSALAALGLEAWGGSALKRWERWAVGALSIAWPLCALWAARHSERTWGEDSVPLQGTPVGTSVAMWLLVALGAALLLLPASVKRRRAILASACLALCAMGGILFALPGIHPYWNRSAPALAPPVAQALARADGRCWMPGRGLWQCLSPNLATLFSVRDVRYISPLTPKRLLPLAGELKAGFHGFADWSAGSLEFAGVTAAWRWVDEKGGTDVRLSRPASPLPRALWVQESERSATAGDAMARALKDRAWARTAFLEGDPGPSVEASNGAASDAPQSWSSQSILDSCNRTAWRVTAPTAGWLVLRDLYWPGWKATVDGIAARVLPADGVFRAVRVPAGTHEVVFTYRPGTLTAGIALSLAALALSVIVWVRSRGRGPGA